MGKPSPISPRADIACNMQDQLLFTILYEMVHGTCSLSHLQRAEAVPISQFATGEPKSDWLASGVKQGCHLQEQLFPSLCTRLCIRHFLSASASSALTYVIDSAREGCCSCMQSWTPKVPDVLKMRALVDELGANGFSDLLWDAHHPVVKEPETLGIKDASKV